MAEFMKAIAVMTGSAAIIAGILGFIIHKMVSGGQKENITSHVPDSGVHRRAV